MTPDNQTTTVQLPPVRRIVTAVDVQGRSVFQSIGTSPAVRTHAARPGYVVSNLWRTEGSPAAISAVDSIERHEGIRPPICGSVLRIIDFPPEPKDATAFERAVEATFAQTFGNDAHRDGRGSDPSMHTTDSIDYALMLAGELVAVMDEGECVMRPGDVLIQRGTRHGWRNRSGQPARIAFVLLDGQRE